ncbi:Gfo/Idh/MocA family oxidoreductase [Microbacterium sp. CFBP 8790]|uniref:Gfo/Idh/MocA family protein n=1 Tax=unclassified Microbacterium TaxID=2609290 RepID=UPI001781FCBA|nr:MULTISPECIES: Gfo/Idh/MocA family oxidoreductase [unclassified Microbacterium]MBD8206796.1 Gfo/Idh/MocA family oxidoreductase [Microbacterium sp. CFBP 8801]MBD8509215.1 Gfo/Idh/MocA family oxidoreductase [Microbacterium sp. CFBP 8790]
MAWGVGIIGAGPGVAALHAPTLARTAGDFRLVHVSDAGSGRAAAIAERFGARSSSGLDALLADPDVDVVAICSPPAQHAAHVRASLAAGRRALFCEKPLATSLAEAEQIVAACAAAGALLVVGTNHLFDPAWVRATHYLDAIDRRIAAVTVTLCLSPNDRYHALVMGEPLPAPPGSARPPLDLSDPAQSAAIVRQLIVGLAVHDLPLVRDLVPDATEVAWARPIAPIGFDLGLRSADAVVRFTVLMVPEGADSLWRVSIATAGDRIDVDFPPPFVHAGSARIAVRDARGVETVYPLDRRDGYDAEWGALAALLRGDTAMEYDELRADAAFVLAVADAAAAVIRGGGAPGSVVAPAPSAGPSTAPSLDQSAAPSAGPTLPAPAPAGSAS